MEAFSARTTLNLADWQALLKEAGTRFAAERQEQGSQLLRAAPSALWLIFVAAFVFMLNTTPPLIRPLGIVISLVGFFGTWWLQYYIQRRAFTPRARGSFLGEHQFDFEAGGFRIRRVNSEAFNRWSLISSISHTDSHLFLWIEGYSAYVVPARDLPVPADHRGYRCTSAQLHGHCRRRPR